MYYKLKRHTIFRDFKDIGYLIYQRSPLDIDRVVNDIGAVFMSFLSYEPTDIEKIAQKAALLFHDVSEENIKKDITEFYETLAAEGFLNSGKTYDDCAKKTDDFDNAVSQEALIDSIIYDKSGTRTGTQEYLEQYFSNNPKLLKFQIEITNKCNERCVHCYIPHAMKSFTMDDGTYYDLLEQLKRLGVVSLGISGGEPMLHPSFYQFIEAAKKIDVNITVLTNLTLLKDEYIDLFKDGRVTVIASLYSLVEEHHDKITQLPGSCKQTKKALLKLLENNIPVQINCPLMKDNKDDFVDLVKWARKRNVMVRTDYCLLARCDRSTDNLENRIEIEHMQKIIDELTYENKYLQKIISADDYEEQCSYLFNDVNGHWCGVAFTCCSVDAYGNVLPCPSWSDYSAGNIHERPLKEIWLDSEKFKYIRSLTKNDFTKCVNCEDRAYCSVCMARNANESPDKSPLEVNDYFCRIAKRNHNSVEAWRSKNLQKA